jgi:tRNA (mo5U34)-methyltransferase
LTELLERAKELKWYHALELAPGHVTPGMFDLRPYVRHYHLPERMDGMRVLDVGTWDGFWAFEMERRGAQVTGLDIDDLSQLDFPPRRRPKEFPTEARGQGFHLAREIFGSNAERVVCNIYDARPENLGTFDLVFAGSILIHLRDQLLALERIANLVKPGGLFVSAEEYDLASNFVPFKVSRYRADRDSAVVFWLPSIRTWANMIWTAGFDDVDVKGRFKMRSPHSFHVRHAVFHARR